MPTIFRNCKKMPEKEFSNIARSKLAHDNIKFRFYGAEFCLVLRFLHGNGIIYRDIKLENIMLTSDGHIKVMNFDVSVEGLHDHYATTKSFCGTTNIMAPEACYHDHRNQLHGLKDLIDHADPIGRGLWSCSRLVGLWRHHVPNATSAIAILR